MKHMKTKRKWLCLLMALLLFTAPSHSVFAEEETEDDTEPLAPYFIIYDADSDVDRLPLKATEVTANINGAIADIYVRQTYANEGEHPINASYVFPASSDVAIHGMTMQVGDDIVTSQIKEKEEATQEYVQAKEEGKSASLLEQQRPNVFKMDIANIMPDDIVSIELHYTELITPIENIYEFTYPTVVGPRYAELTKDNETELEKWVISPYLPNDTEPIGEYKITVNLSTGVPISEVSCKSHEISVAKDTDSIAHITLTNPDDYAGNRDFILKYKLTGEEIQSGLIATVGEDENYYMLTVQPPSHYTPDEIPPREYIFVLDVSGSMFGYPLDTAKTLIRDLVSNLKESDTFNLILFSDDARMMSPVSLYATERNIENATDLIDDQQGGGGTSMLPALEKALSVPPSENTARSIVLITDGFIFDEEGIFSTITQNMDKYSFFSFGIGTSVNDYLIDGIAKASGGESFIVTDAEDAKDSAERFCTYIQSPLLTDIQISFDGFETYDTEPTIPSTLFAQKPIILFGKWRGELSGNIHITGRSGNKDYEQTISVVDAAVCEEGNTLGYLWARNRLESLTDYGCNENDEAVKEEVTQLGLKYSMMTPYTSFVSVIDKVRNLNGDSADVQQASPLPLGVSDLAAGGGYYSYSEPEEIVLILMMAAILFLSRLILTVKQHRQKMR